MTDDLLPLTKNYEAVRIASDLALPDLLLDARAAARFAFEEFFHGQLRNPHTRRNYLLALRRFSDWCRERRLELIRVTPRAVSGWFAGGHSDAEALPGGTAAVLR